MDAPAAGLAATASWALRQPVFRWYAAAFAAQATAVIVVAVHLVPMVRQHGHCAAFAAAATGALTGLLAFITTLATTAGPVAAGVSRTLTGSYTPALVGILGLCTAAAVGLVRADHLATSTPMCPPRQAPCAPHESSYR